MAKFLATAASVCLVGSTTVPILPAFAASIDSKTAQKQAEIPTCGHKIGTLAVREPDTRWWEGLGLVSPEALLKVFVMKSGCFTLVDRGKAFEMAQQERALAPGGTLQGGANIGAGQVRAADYILVPDIASKKGNSGGTNVGGLLGGFRGGFAGAIVSNINVSSKTADVVLTVTNVRTSEQQAIAQGHGSKTDVGFGVGGGGFGLGGFGAAGISNYQNTAIGQVVILAYIDAYTKLVGEMGGLSTNAKADAPAQTKRARFSSRWKPEQFSIPPAPRTAFGFGRDDVEQPSRALEAGELDVREGGRDHRAVEGVGILDRGRAQPLSARAGLAEAAASHDAQLRPVAVRRDLVEVSDEVGNKGWVSQLSIANYK
ncbi:MAG: peptidoglycan-binding protein [Alphaproteobacteria bacterium]|nr:peptidoglycan-binding protein [Alphaproteobacteria bacterium]